MTAVTTHSVHYEKLMRLMDDLLINLDKCHEILDNPEILEITRTTLQSFCNQQKIVLESMAQELGEFENTHRILQKENLVDEMTGLIAKRHLLPVIGRQVAINNRIPNQIRTGCLIVIDINNMKVLNKTFGHFGADDILIKITDLAKSFLRDNDFAFRVGGDEFVFYVQNIDAQRVSKTIIKRISDSLSREPIRAVALKDADKPNPPKTQAKITFCLGAVNLPNDMPDNNEEIKQIIITKLREADALEIEAKNYSNKEITIAYKNENGDTVIETETEMIIGKNKIKKAP